MNSFHSSNPLSLEKQLVLKTKCHGATQPRGAGGSEKCQNSVTYYLNGRLLILSLVKVICLGLLSVKLRVGFEPWSFAIAGIFFKYGLLQISVTSTYSLLCM